MSKRPAVCVLSLSVGPSAAASSAPLRSSSRLFDANIDLDRRGQQKPRSSGLASSTTEWRNVMLFAYIMRKLQMLQCACVCARAGVRYSGAAAVICHRSVMLTSCGARSIQGQSCWLHCRSEI
ncbi:hypothetical protein AMECASPLE_014673 [Ameca splendens]|uniref:Secreted protein n=1 Tax=Ameca splendens TaxID=208324 RepID=A0ABV0ZAJ0_9TELE